MLKFADSLHGTWPSHATNIRIMHQFCWKGQHILVIFLYLFKSKVIITSSIIWTLKIRQLNWMCPKLEQKLKTNSLSFWIYMIMIIIYSLQWCHPLKLHFSTSFRLVIHYNTKILQWVSFEPGFLFHGGHILWWITLTLMSLSGYAQKQISNPHSTSVP